MVGWHVAVIAVVPAVGIAAAGAETADAAVAPGIAAPDVKLQPSNLMGCLSVLLNPSR